MFEELEPPSLPPMGPLLEKVLREGRRRRRAAAVRRRIYRLAAVGAALIVAALVALLVATTDDEASLVNHPSNTVEAGDTIADQLAPAPPAPCRSPGA